MGYDLRHLGRRTRAVRVHVPSPLRSAIFTYAAPVYPLLSGGITAIAQVGHGVAFPSGAALGHIFVPKRFPQ